MHTLPRDGLLTRSTDIGANDAEGGGDEGVEDGAQQVNNVVNSFRLQSTQFDKKSYVSHLKSNIPVADLPES